MKPMSKDNHAAGRHDPPYAAEAACVPVQTDALMMEETDAPSLQRAGAGTMLGVVSVPCRYRGAGIEVADIRDAIRFLRAHAEEYGSDPERIALFGMGASLLVAHDLQLKLMRLDIDCQMSHDLHSQLLSASNLRAGDLAIVVSYSGMTEDVLRCARVARQSGATIVSITRGSFASPLVDLSDVVLGVAATELVVRSGAMSSRIAQLNVVDVLFTTYLSRNYEKSMERLSSNWIKKGASDGDARERCLGRARVAGARPSAGAAVRRR